MSDRNEAFDDADADISQRFPPLPEWLASRFGGEEEITWVAGPRFNPPWERYVTHPLLFVAALAVGVVVGGAGWLLAKREPVVFVLLGGFAGAIAIGSIFVLGISNGYFTRLVVTTRRLVILQGYEVCRIWAIDRLPRSLLRYRRLGDDAEEGPAIDLDAIKTLLGGTSDKFAEAGKILALGKRLDQIKTGENDRSL